MHLSLPTLPLLAHLVCPVYSVQIGRGLPVTVNDISAISLSTSHHIGYVDQRVRQNGNGYMYLNHEQWHQRNTRPPLNDTSDISSTASTVSPPSSLPSTIATNTASHATSNIATLDPASLTDLLHATKALATDGAIDWDQQTDTTCISTLKTLNGLPSNPSGISVCYNVRSLNNSTGVFQVDLRLFQIASSTGSWSQLRGSDVSLDLIFAGATVYASSTRKEKRGMVRITLPAIAGQDAKDVYRMRATGALPRKLSRSRFQGNVDGDLALESMKETTIHSVLTPNITLSGTMQNGTSLSARLPIKDASFICGLFVGTNVSDEITSQKEDELLPSGANPAFSPTSLIITGIWALLLVMTMGYGRMVRINARDTYRRRLKSRLSGGGGSRF